MESRIPTSTPFEVAGPIHAEGAPGLGVQRSDAALPRRPGLRVPRVLGDLAGAPDGPTLICVAGLHGNEPAGVLALERVFARLQAPSDAVGLGGRFLGLAGNLQALAAGRRFLDHDLNRCWTREHLARVMRGEGSPLAETAELRELYGRLREVLDSVPGPRRQSVYLLDLHTASGPGPAFTVLDDTLPNRAFALELQVPVVLGIEEELRGTLMHRFCEWGGVGAGFEAGQHQDPEAVDRAEAAIWVALEVSGLLPRGRRSLAAEGRERLAAASDALPRVVEVRYRHAITPDDAFRIEDGLVGFQPVRSGQTLAHDRWGTVAASEDGLLLMPLYQSQGEDGFFLVRAVDPVWLEISAVVRRLRLERVLHWLPGVRRHPELEETFLVDRKIARWVALELFHLLGFRRKGPPGRYLTLIRRTGDRPDPS